MAARLRCLQRFPTAVCCVATILLVGGGASLATAATYLIEPDGSGDFPTIQDAVSAASDGDTIELADGTFSTTAPIDFLGKAITLRSLNADAELCKVVGSGSQLLLLRTGEGLDTVIENLTLDQEGSGSVCIQCDDTTPTIIGCIVRRATDAGILSEGTGPSVRGCLAEGCAYGMRLRGNLVYDIENCSFVSNSRRGLDVRRGPDLRISGCTFVDNGIGLDAEGFFGSLTVESCTFDGEHIGALTGGFTDLVFQDCVFKNGQIFDSLLDSALRIGRTDSAVIRRCRFENNEGGQLGAGGITTSGVVDIESCHFEGNNGGAVLTTGAVGVTLRQCKFIDNQATQRAGAIQFDSGSNTVEDCLFIGNSSPSAGAIHALGNEATIRSSTFVQNSSSSASAILAGASTLVQLQQVLITGGTGGAPRPVVCEESATVVATCTDIFGNGGDWSGCLQGQDQQQGNLNVDPLYCDPVGRDFTLREDSPCAETQSACGQIGAFPVECGGPVPTVTVSWGALKRAFSR